MGEDRLTDAFQEVMAGLEPSDELRARAERLRAGRQRRRVVTTGFVALAVVGALATAIPRDDAPGVTAGPSDGACRESWRELEPRWLPDGFTHGGDQLWVGPDGASLALTPPIEATAMDGTDSFVVDGRAARVALTEPDPVVLVEDAPGTCAFTVEGHGVAVGELRAVAASLARFGGQGVLWPLGTEIDRADDDARRDPVSAARRFLTELAGWEEPFDVVDNPITARYATAVATRVDGVSARLELRDTGSLGLWSVLSVSTLPRDQRFSVDIEREDDGGGRIDVNIEPDQPVAAVELAVSFGAVGAATSYPADSTELSLSWEGGAHTPWSWGSSGRVLVIYRDLNENVVDVWGVAVPPTTFQLHGTGNGDSIAGGTWERRNGRDSFRGSSLWYSVSEQLAPSAEGFEQLFAAGTWLMLPGDRPACAPFPGAAITALRDTDAFLVIYEDLSADSIESVPARPSTFERTTSNSDGSAECVPGKLFDHDWIGFRDNNREFHLFVAMGPDVSDATRAVLWRTADSFTAG